jgi:hypothetical protein
MHMGARGYNPPANRGGRGGIARAGGRFMRSRSLGLGNVEQQLADADADDDALRGLEGARFIYKGSTYMVEGGDIYSLQGYAIDDGEQLGALASLGFFKKIGRMVKRVTKSKRVRRVVKAAAVVGAVGAVAYGGWALYSAYGAKLAAGASSLGSKLLGKRGSGVSDQGVSVPEPSQQAIETSAGGRSFDWSSAAGAAANVAGKAFDVIGARGASRQEQRAAAEAADAYANFQAGGGRPGAGGLTSDYEPDGTPRNFPDNRVPGEAPDAGVPDVSRFAMAGMSPMMLLLGGGILLAAFMKKR